MNRVSIAIQNLKMCLWPLTTSGHTLLVRWPPYMVGCMGMMCSQCDDGVPQVGSCQCTSACVLARVWGLQCPHSRGSSPLLRTLILSVRLLPTSLLHHTVAGLYTWCNAPKTDVVGIGTDSCFWFCCPCNRSALPSSHCLSLS